MAISNPTRHSMGRLCSLSLRL